MNHRLIGFLSVFSDEDRWDVVGILGWGESAIAALKPFGEAECEGTQAIALIVVSKRDSCA